MGDHTDEREIIAPRADALLWAIRKALHEQHFNVTDLVSAVLYAEDHDNPHPLLDIFRALLDWHASTPSVGRHLEPLIDALDAADRLARTTDDQYFRDFPRAIVSRTSRARSWADSARSLARDLTGEDETE